MRHRLCQPRQHTCCHRYHHHQQRHALSLCTHIYPLQVAVGLRRGHHSVVGVDDGHDVHTEQLLQRAVQILPLLVIMEIQICHQDLRQRRRGGEIREQGIRRDD